MRTRVGTLRRIIREELTREAFLDFLPGRKKKKAEEERTAVSAVEKQKLGAEETAFVKGALLHVLGVVHTALGKDFEAAKVSKKFGPALGAKETSTEHMKSGPNHIGFEWPKSWNPTPGGGKNEFDKRFYDPLLAHMQQEGWYKSRTGIGAMVKEGGPGGSYVIIMDDGAYNAGGGYCLVAVARFQTS